MTASTARTTSTGFSPLTTLTCCPFSLLLRSAGGDVLCLGTGARATVEPMQAAVRQPARPGIVTFSTGKFATELSLDDEGFVRHYPDLATLVVT